MEMKSDIERVVEHPKIPTSDGSKIIYVAGKYRGRTTKEGLIIYNEQAENILHAQRVAIRLWELGWVVFCPHLNTANFNWYSNLPDEVWLNGGLKFLELCQAILMLKGFEESVGAKRELEVAIEMGLTVLYE